MRSPAELAVKNSRTGQRHSRCKECGRRTSREHYLLNHAAYIERNRQNNPRDRTQNATAVLEYLQLHPCIMCDESDPVLESNHKDPGTKSANISDLVRFGCSPTRLFNEIAKCEVMCANCHQRYTSLGRPKHYRRAAGQGRALGIPSFRAAANARNHALVCSSSQMRHASTAANRIG